MYDKDWEVHLALNNPLDPIHGYMEDYLKKEEAKRGEESHHETGSDQRDHSRAKHGTKVD